MSRYVATDSERSYKEYDGSDHVLDGNSHQRHAGAIGSVGEDELRMAARAGMLLLEKNAELEYSIDALNADVLRYQHQYRELEIEVEVLRDQRKEAVLEVQVAHRDIKQLKAQILHEHAEWERIHDELQDTIHQLRTDLHHAKLSGGSSTLDSENQSDDGSSYYVPSSCSLSSVCNEAPQAHMIEMDVYDDVCSENAELHAQLRRAHEELTSLHHERARARTMEVQIKNLEHQVLQVQREKRLLKEEQDEERLLIESLRAMVQTYKKIADARPFSIECSCALTDDEAEGAPTAPFTSDMRGPHSLHDDVVQVNLALKDEIASLKQQLAAVEALPPPPPVESDSILRDKVEDLEARLEVTVDTLRHTKQQWMTAVVMQKEAQECCEAAQAEIDRLTELVQHHVRTLGAGNPPQKTSSDEAEWVQDHGVHPAPPGDLNSPLIQCLLEHWTRDKAQRKALSEWLQGAICESRQGPPTLRLDKLSSEVSAGFVQLLVPILRQVHGVNVTIMKRASMHVLSDLILDVSKAKVPLAATNPALIADRLKRERARPLSLTSASFALPPWSLGVLA
ncbi:hypothetical protein SPRG_13078 [Saprolegnia parasitica CBS 223.65]|uniref:Uncharacterized protein n=1 Tax=Saprolegnia parasitica (strain CBS 223.65) TaxID=695850 RepID=A0A067BNZ0_SAPPC|nr:hypothetical protein SPRG_13078 [Saprolegnia parasitica CBS 223.65]KDO19973.1 hypothetical protein SPRG_13078 [Saprolegnia parasitica CBS 223.65]|eukprot:XP_012209343.1 hypothetical protein SPRG_13078 [Saprolegnia parasitica CBS 223.65]